MNRIAVVAALLLASLVPASAQQGQRLALVIGNAAYQSPGWQLANPVNDATLIAQRLRGLGFTVDPVMNASRARMEGAITAFGQRLRAAGPDAVGVFYYAGHGVEHDGANLLVPVDVTARSVDELRFQAPPMQFVLRDMARAGNAVNIVVLDACRNLPLPSGTRNGPAGGLADLDDAPPDVLVAYATRAGFTAPDNPGETNSVFTRTLAEALSTQAGDPLELLFSNVQAKVFSATGRQQRPEFRSGLLRAPGFRLAAVTGATVDPELERLRRENDALRRLGAGTTPSPAVSAPAVAVQRPDAGGGARAPGAVFRDCAECPEMVSIPGGTFLMGSSASEPGRDTDEGPQRYVTVRAFAAGKYEVTFDEWDACARGGGCAGYAPDDQGWGRGRQPVINVSWNDAQAYVTWLNSRAGGARYRLLSEAEWEYAARAGTSGRFSNNGAEADLCRIGNHADQSTSYSYKNAACNDGVGERTAPVGRYAANPFGLHDMHGNVWEWTQDCYVNTHSGFATDGSANTTGDCSDRVIRGGSWSNYPAYLRSAYRNGSTPSNRLIDLGFRVARTL